MKSLRMLSVIVCALFVASTASVQAGCCDDAKKAGKECSHKCCVEAAKAKKSCDKCNAKTDKKEEKK